MTPLSFAQERLRTRFAAHGGCRYTWLLGEVHAAGQTVVPASPRTPRRVHLKDGRIAYDTRH